MNKEYPNLLKFLFSEDDLKSSEIAGKTKISLRTVQRSLSFLEKEGQISRIGQGKNIRYKLTNKARLNYIPDIQKDLADSRLETENSVYFDFEIFDVLEKFTFETEETQTLDFATKLYDRKKNNANPILTNKEMQRLIIEFSWKSSKIEGNTYSLLDTEELIKSAKMAPGKTQEETQMILNHKRVFDFLTQNKDYFQKISTKKIVELHSIITFGLKVSTGFRTGGVGITGSLYKPLDNYHQIQEAMEKTCNLLNKIKDPLARAFLAGVLLSYIQPFFDGNKRTSRMLANSILFTSDLPLLSYRNVTVESYKNSVLIFYEKKSLFLAKKIFVGQLKFFSENYF